MEHLRTVLEEAQRRGLLQPGRDEIEKVVQHVDPKDLRLLARRLHGWQQKIVDHVQVWCMNGGRSDDVPRLARGDAVGFVPCTG